MCIFCKITIPKQGTLIGQPFYVRRDMLFLSVNWHAGQLSLIGAHATMSMVPRSVDITTNYIGFKTVDEFRSYPILLPTLRTLSYIVKQQIIILQSGTP